VDGLAKAIKEFKGGVVLVSHDFRLIDQVSILLPECGSIYVAPPTSALPTFWLSLFGVTCLAPVCNLPRQVADQIMICENKGVKRFDGSIHEYKKILAGKMQVHKV
jgi:ATP-binding cassette subfamily F protein 2